MERLTIWVSAGKISGLINLMIFVSIGSRPNEVELLSFDITCSTSSGCTAEKEKLQDLPCIKVLRVLSGSEAGGGRFSLRRLIFSTK